MPTNGIIDQLSTPTPKQLSLEGQPGPIFEDDSQQTTSIIHYGPDGTASYRSQDLLEGRRFNIGRQSYFAPPSAPPVSFPDAFVFKPYYPSLGGPYTEKGPAKGRYS